MLNDIPIAYFHLEIDNNKCWFGVCVNKMYQGIGVSSLIINYVKVFCTLNNIGRIHLTVDSDNTVAINAYNKQGFTVVQNNINNIEMCLNIKGFKNV
jgi:RimJ/RimL family protein N-acetyltransferase